MPTTLARCLPTRRPSFIKKRWEKLVFTADGIDRRYYELCALSELKNALRSGDIWVQGSRQFKDFDEYLMPAEKFAALKLTSDCRWPSPPTATSICMIDCCCWNSSLDTVNRMAAANDPTRCHHHRIGPEDHAAGCGRCPMPRKP